MVSKFKLNPVKTGETKEAISRTLAIANDYAGELSIEVLPLDKIELDPENNRELALTLHDAMNGVDPSDPDYAKKKNDWKSLESLAKTIVDDQLINPIFVYRFGNKCRLIAGERRTLASAIAGKKEIIARIASQRPVGTKLRVLQWIENNERVDLSLAERVASLEAIVKEYLNENKEKSDKEKITSKVISDLTGMSITQSRRYILILQTTPEIKQAIAEGKLENIKLIELIISVENIEHQQVLLKAASENLSFDAIVKLKKELESSLAQKKEIRGRKQLNVSLGKVKPNIAKIIFDALVSSNIIHESIIKQMNMISDNVQWNNGKSVEECFKKIIPLIAQEV
ncbi:ParB/RepB/Spo0J family partition protein [Legionella waltersii]|uniref:Putative chromosome-partitioning protein ParB n=1 Tax=Legionella waltersii TaxID=66969 RepID=A0A0W1AMK6_9GAMM|nr:ParB/RepB/Spo0J family partition protein [Legionella waltersii]KTD82564.1 putative chromosome-partitioning protein ParB [Legionella waltersii]SNU94916.1 chromosome-partitioning protein parB [Legionella waltersii]